MKAESKTYAAIVLRNTKSELSSVRYTEVVSALLAGGVILGEMRLISYEDGERVEQTLSSLASDNDGVFFICDKILTQFAREVAAKFTRKNASADLFETKENLIAVLPTGERGAKMAKEVVAPAVNERRKERFCRLVIRLVSAPAGAVLSAVAKAQKAADDKVSICTGEEYGCQRIEIIYNQNAPRMTTDEVVRILAEDLREYIYSMEDVTIAKCLADLLNLHRLHVCAAESFTGGGVGKALVEIPGASNFFFESVNAYDNQAKIERLNVSPYTLQNYGAVSSQTAYEMASGLLAGGHCDLALATTGIAGPASDNTNKPVGMCFLAVGTRERVRVYEYHLKGTREEITQTAINLILFLAYEEVKQNGNNIRRR